MSVQRQIRVAFRSVPKDAGTFTFYRNLRPALLGHGIDLRCVSLGRDDAHLCEADYVDEGCHLLVPRSSSLKRQARTFTDWCEAERIDIVMGINSAGNLSALPHLPNCVRIMSRCANSFNHGYGRHDRQNGHRPHQSADSVRIRCPAGPRALQQCQSCQGLSPLPKVADMTIFVSLVLCSEISECRNLGAMLSPCVFAMASVAMVPEKETQYECRVLALLNGQRTTAAEKE